jgi:nucleotide-binding universal stress UspA family protein
LYEKMLVPLDGSELAEMVFPYAAEIAGKMGTDIDLFLVSGPSAQAMVPMQSAYIKHAAEIVEKQVEEIRSGLKKSTGTVKVQGEQTEGYPADEILRYAEERDVDMILMSSHGLSGNKRWSIGSVANKIMSASKIPVLLVRAGESEEAETEKWQIKSVLVPLDGSELAESVLPHVKALGKQEGPGSVEVVLLRVCEPPTIPSYYGPELSGVPLDWGKYVEQELVREKQRAAEYLTELEAKFKAKGIKVRSEVIQGKPDDEIVEYANKNKFSMIIMATHGRSGFSRLVYGSVAANLLHGVSSPLLVVKPEGKK